MEAVTARWTDDRIDDLRAGVDSRFDLVDRRFDQVDQRFEQVDKRFEQVDQRFEQIDKRFEHVERRFERIEARLDGIQQSIVELNGRMSQFAVVFTGALVGLMTTQLGLILTQL
jgi:uncharacterized protein (DUF3084 family)